MNDIRIRLTDGGPNIITSDVALKTELLPGLKAAPGGPEGSSTADSARLLLEDLIERSDETRHWTFEDPQMVEFLWALERAMMDGKRLSPPLFELRNRLIDSP